MTNCFVLSCLLSVSFSSSSLAPGDSGGVRTVARVSLSPSPSTCVFLRKGEVCLLCHFVALSLTCVGVWVAAMLFFMLFFYGEGWPFCVVEVQPSKQPWPQWRWHSSLPSDRLPAFAVQTHACLQRNQPEKQELFLSHDPYTRIRDISPLGSGCVFYEIANMNPQNK